MKIRIIVSVFCCHIKQGILCEERHVVDRWMDRVFIFIYLVFMHLFLFLYSLPELSMMLDSDQANKLNSRLHVLFGGFSIFVGVSPWWRCRNIQLKSESLSQSWNTVCLLSELPCVFLIRFVFLFFLSSVVFIFLPSCPPQQTHHHSLWIRVVIWRHTCFQVSPTPHKLTALLSPLACHRAES